jgi:hypothetical protein
MRTGFIGWLAIIINAIAFVPAGAHLFALPNKMRLAEKDYFVAQSIYGGWAMFGYVFLAAFVINIVFALLLRRQTLPFILCAAAALCIGSSCERLPDASGWSKFGTFIHVPSVPCGWTSCNSIFSTVASGPSNLGPKNIAPINNKMPTRKKKSSSSVFIR